MTHKTLNINNNTIIDQTCELNKIPEQKEATDFWLLSRATTRGKKLFLCLAVAALTVGVTFQREVIQKSLWPG